RRVTTHSEELLMLVDEVMREANWGKDGFDALVCGAGPGSFTGLRIGLATAKGLCYAAQRPLVLVSSLQALAARASGPDGGGQRVCAVLDAHKGEVYAGLFSIEAGVPRPLAAEQAVAPAILAAQLQAHVPLQLVGDGVTRYPELVGPGRTRLDEEGSPRSAEL